MPGPNRQLNESAGQPFVEYVTSLAFGALERATGLQAHLGADADVGLDLPGQLANQQLALAFIKVLALRTQFYMHLHAIQVSIAIQMYFIKLLKLNYF